MPRLISVDLGAHSVKVCTWQQVKGRFEPDLRLAQPVPQDGQAQVPMEARLAAFQALLESHPQLRGASGDQVFLAWGGAKATCHRLQVPFSDAAQIEKTLPFAIEAEVPFELADMVLAWRLVSSGERTEVLANLVPRDELTEAIAALAGAKLDPSLVYLDGEVHGHWVDPSGPVPLAEGGNEPAPLVAVLDVGHDHSVLSVVRQGRVVLWRAIDVGGRLMTRAVQTTLGCTFEEAQAMKEGTEPGRSGYGELPVPARKAIDGVLGLILAEVRTTLIRAEDALGAEIVELRVGGGGARIEALARFLQQDLGVRVDWLRDPDGEEVPFEFELAHALAMQGARKTSLRCADLRVGDLAFRGSLDTFRLAVTYGGTGLVVFVLAALVLFVVQYWRLRSELADVEDQIAQVVAATLPDLPSDQVDPSQAELLLAGLTEDAVQRADALRTGDRTTPPVLDLFHELHLAFPPADAVAVNVSEISISPTAISLTAETDGYAASSEVEASLQKNPRFKAASKGTEQKAASKVRFAISIPLDGAAAEAADEEG